MRSVAPELGEPLSSHSAAGGGSEEFPARGLLARGEKEICDGICSVGEEQGGKR